MTRMGRFAFVLAVVACARPRATTVVAPVRPAVIEWHIGVNKPDRPEPMIETVLPATLDGKQVWRVVHRDGDPLRDGAHNAYDMYDVDPATLVPVRSVMAREGFYFALTFEADRVKIEKRENDRREETEVRVTNPMPEGPGLKVLLASLPLRPGYTTTFSTVDRWAKDEASRVVSIALAVVGRQTLRTPLGRCDVLEVTLAPAGGGYHIREWVRAERPHYVVKTEYQRGSFVLVSEVVRMVIDGVAEACSP